MRPGRGYPSGDTPASELPPPFDPDPELIDHLEGNQRSLRGYRREAEKMSDKREGHTGSGDGTAMRPSPPIPSGYTVTNPWTTYRTLDPVKAAALHEANQLCYSDTPVDDVLAVAERFERWLAGTDEEHP